MVICLLLNVPAIVCFDSLEPWMPFRLAIWCAVWGMACTPVREPGPLVDLSSWMEAYSDEDPFEDRPDHVECPPSSRVIETEDGVSFLEIDTGLCNYITLRQDSLMSLMPGDKLIFEWGHRELNAGEKDFASSHMAFWVDQTVIEEVEVEIPAIESRYTVEVDIQKDIEAGSPVWLHLHNHGANQWFFYAAQVEPL